MKGTFRCVLVFLTLISLSGKAQQYPQFSLFNYNLNAYNPAYTGVEDRLSVTAQIRTQWLGISRNPFSQALTAHAPVQQLHGGLGITAINNQQGLQRNTHAALDYAFIIRSRNFVISLGARGGIIQSSLDGSKIITPSGNYENGINHNDDILPTAMKSSISPDVAAGIALHSKKITLGVSAVNLTEPKLQLTEGGKGVVLNRNIFSHFSYNIKLSDNVKFSNAFLVKYDFADLQEETNIALHYKTLGWIGAGFRGFTPDNRDAVYALAGIRLAKNWVIAYAYDYTLSTLNQASTGSHELIINYALELSGIAKPGKFIYTPRF